MNGTELSLKLRTLTVFRALRADAVIAALSRYLDDLARADTASALEAYAAFVSALYEAHTDDLGAYVQDCVNDDENAYIRCIGRGDTPSALLNDSVRAELSILQEVADITPDTLRAPLDFTGYLPRFSASKVDLAAGYFHRVAHIGRYGYGMYARYRMFYLDDDGHIVPVQYPDTTRLADLIDYEREQQILMDNTRALIAGKPAANILLTGDVGTGKSSTVKAVVNELYTDGLRILEVRKEQLRALPALLDALTCNPLKFILFIDDLSFQKDDDNYSALKAVLEGSVSAKSQNVVIYATSNRRHLVKESFSDREGDDVHFNDTVQECLSLSERFGIQITFNRPSKQTYLDIVHHLAQRNGIACTDDLDVAAERFALGRGIRSARAARQFIDSLLAGTHL